MITHVRGPSQPREGDSAVVSATHGPMRAVRRFGPAPQVRRTEAQRMDEFRRALDRAADAEAEAEAELEDPVRD